MTDLGQEKTELLDMLDLRRNFLVQTVAGLTDEQASATPTVSTLCLAGLVKHVTANEAGWVDFMRHGPATKADEDWGSVDWDAIADGSQEVPAWLAAHEAQWHLAEGETLADLVGALNEQAAHTRIVVTDLDLDHRHDLPEAPWFEPGAQWSNRQVLLHLVGETAQHAGHADIIRESIDGQRTMG